MSVVIALVVLLSVDVINTENTHVKCHTIIQSRMQYRTLENVKCSSTALIRISLTLRSLSEISFRAKQLFLFGLSLRASYIMDDNWK